MLELDYVQVIACPWDAEQKALFAHGKNFAHYISINYQGRQVLAEYMTYIARLMEQWTWVSGRAPHNARAREVIARFGLKPYVDPRSESTQNPTPVDHR